MGRLELRGQVIWVKQLAEAKEVFFLDCMIRVQGSKLVKQSAGSLGCGPGHLVAAFQCWAVKFSNFGMSRNLEA